MVDVAYEIEISGPEGMRVVRTLDAPVEVGREADWALDDIAVSRRHVMLEPSPAGVVVRDLGSSNGTAVNGARLSAPTVASPGDVVEVGSSRLLILGVTAPPAPPPPPPPAPQAAPPPPPPPPPAAAPPPSPPPVAPQPAPAAPQPQGAPPHSEGAGPQAEGAAQQPEDVASPMPPVPPPASHRPALDELVAIETEAAVVRYRPGSVAETVARTVAKDIVRARRQLANLGSEPWGVAPQVCLVDPFPDPDRPGEVVTSGAVVDASRGEIWVAVTADRPPETPERYLARFFGASLPAGDDLALLLDGFGLHLAGTTPDDDLRQLDLPPLGDADDDVNALMACSFVAYLVRRESNDAFLRFLATARPGSLEVAARDIYGDGLNRLEQSWRNELERGPVKARPRAFFRLAARELRPHWVKQIEISLYMLMGLGFTTAFPFVFRELVDKAIPSGEWNQVAQLLTLLAGVLAVSLLASLRRSYLSAQVSIAVTTSIRTRMFERLQRLSPGWFHQREQGDVLSRFFSDVGQLEAGFSAVIREGAFQVLGLIVSAVVLVTLHPMLGLIVFAGIPAVALIYSRMSDGALTRSMTVQEQSGSLLNVVSENYSAQPVVKAFALESREVARFGRASSRLFDSSLRLSLFGGVFGLSVNGVVTILRLVVLGLGAWLILDDQFTIGGLVAFIGVMGDVLGPVGALTGIGQQLQTSTGALARVDEILVAEIDIGDPDGVVELPPLRGEIRLSDVGFAYTSGGPQVLTGIDCVIPAGSKVAFVGPSGAGKSSVLNLLMRFYDVDQGAVTIDGHDIRGVSLASLRRQMGVVFQESFLFDTTVRENLRLGRLDATDAEIEAAARAAAIHDTIVALPNGYDTLVGERGGRLSGGQRQRVAIARAILRNPAILVLDEATSALDPRTERQIAATLDELAQGRTTVAVTHRLASVVDYDQVFVLANGELVEQGTHAELVAKSGVYAGLWAEQTGAAPDVRDAPFDTAVALGRIVLFAGLDRADLAEVAEVLRPVEVAPGERVAEGGGRIWLLREGQGRVLAPGPTGDLQLLAEVGPGQAFGVAALLGEESGIELEATTRLRLLAIDRERMIGLAARFPSVGAMLDGRVGSGPGPDGGVRLRATLGPATGLTVADVASAQRPDAALVPAVEDIRRTLGPAPRAG